MTLPIQIGGALSVIVGVMHLFFRRFFGWESELRKLEPLNATIFWTIHVFLMPTFFLFGFLSFRFPDELAGASALGRTLAGFYAVFWIARGVWQYLYFDPHRAGVSPGLRRMHYGIYAGCAVLALCYGSVLSAAFAAR